MRLCVYIVAICCRPNLVGFCFTVVYLPHISHAHSEHGANTATTAITSKSTTSSVYTRTTTVVGITTTTPATTLATTAVLTSTTTAATTATTIFVPATRSSTLATTAVITTTLTTKIAIAGATNLVNSISANTEHSCVRRPDKLPLQQCQRVLAIGLCNNFAGQCDTTCNVCDTTRPVAAADSFVVTAAINSIIIPASMTTSSEIPSSFAASIDNRFSTDSNNLVTAFDMANIHTGTSDVVSTVSVKARTTDISTITFAAENSNSKSSLDGNDQSKNLKDTVDILTITAFVCAVVLVITMSSVIVVALMMKCKIQSKKNRSTTQIGVLKQSNVVDITKEKQSDSYTVDTNRHIQNDHVLNSTDVVIETKQRQPGCYHNV